MHETVSFALLGTGSVAELHGRALNAVADTGARLVAVGHYDPERAREPDARFGVPCLTEEELIAREDIDVISICTPSGQHARQAIMAARTGKHVLVEKPMALSLEDINMMIEACERAEVKLGVTLQRRTEEPFSTLGDTIEAGELGRLISGLVTVPYYRTPEYYDQAPWRGTREMDGGALMNQGIHLLDLLVWFMGDPISALASARTLVHDIEAEDTIATTLSFSGGEIATVNATTAAVPGFPHRIEVYGTQGGVQIEGEMIKRWETRHEVAASDGPTILPGRSIWEAGAGRDPIALSTEGHARIYRDFVQAILENREPLVNGREGRRSVAAVRMIYDSAGL